MLPDYINIFGTISYRLHNTAGVVVSISYMLWLMYYMVVARSLIKLYVPTREELTSGILRQAYFYFLTYFLGKPNPHHSTSESKFNPMQKAAYVVIMLILLPLVIFTGVLLMYVAPLRELLLLLGGIKMLVGTHFLLALLYRVSLCPYLSGNAWTHTAGSFQAYVEWLG
jgi:thiosulfate reductase cytochrome b subunit